MSDQAKRRNRIVIETQRSGHRVNARSRGRQPRTREGIVALTVVGAAALATFVALFITSRPYDPMNSTVAALQTVSTGTVATQPSPKPSPTVSPLLPAGKTASAESPNPSGETGTVPDDAGIQSQIERALASDPTLSKLDVSTLVEGGRVKIVGSVGSIDLKQRVEKVLRSVRGVTDVDNQLVVTEATP